LNGLGSEFVQSFERGVQAINAPDLIPHAVAEHRVQELLTWLLHVGFVFNSDESAELQRKVRLMIGAAPEKNLSFANTSSGFSFHNSGKPDVTC
jgi:hypothetical protein